MKVEIYHIGKKQKNLYSDAESEFEKRLKHYCQFDNIQIPPVKNASSLPVSELLKAEALLFESKIKGKGLVVLLDENGKQYDSISLSKKIGQFQMNTSKLVFVIGGAYGFDPEFKKQADMRLSLSPMTLPHHLARLVFIEQLYRAFTILNNESYHNE